MADDEQPVEITALNENNDFITNSVKNSLQWFANNLVQKNFIARAKAQEILGMTGVVASKQVGLLMDDVYTKIENAHNKREWFDKFVAIFSRDAAYSELVKKLKGSVGGGTVGPMAGGGSTGVIGSDSSGSAEAPENEAVDMMCYTDWMTLVEKDDGRADELWVLTDEDLWLAGKTLKVSFLDDRIPAWPNDGRGHITEEEILKIANEWHQCGVEQGKDVVPEFVPCGADDIADIRVKFIDSGCPRSKVGTAATRVKAGDPTMWLDLKSPDNCPSFYKRIIRHEFGHALGLKHEHQHPDAPPLTDPGKLREHLRQCYPGFTSEQVEKKIRVQWAALAGGASQKSKYDKESVMHYLIPEEVRANKYVGPTQLPIELSDCDKTNIVLFYSKDAADEEQTPMDTGSGTDRDNGPGGSIVDDSGENGSKGNIKPEDFVGFPEPKLVDLINIVGVRVKVKWRDIGLGLGFKGWELNGIYATKCRELDPPQECMTEVFSQWKSGLKSEYSWRKLAEVLVLPAVNEIELLGHMYKELTNKK